MFAIHGSVTWKVEYTVACTVFAELVAPEITIWLCLRYPEFVHVCEEVEFAEGREKCGDAAAVVGFYGSSGRSAGCGVRRGEGIILSAFWALV